MSKLVFELPTPQTPGFLRRAKKGMEYKEKLQSGNTVDVIDEMVEFLVDYVTEPKDREEAKEALMDATEEQFNELINAMTGSEDKEENPTADGKPSTKSEPSEKDLKQDSQNGQ